MHFVLKLKKGVYMQKEKAILFGIGENYRKRKNELEKEYQIVALIDNNVAKQGLNDQTGEMVYSIDILSKIEYDRIIITTPLFEKEVFKQLLGFGISVEKIILTEKLNYLKKYRKIWGNYLPNKDEKLCSSVCRPSDFEKIPQWKKWGLSSDHRKWWEYIYIYQALKEREVLKIGSKGLGFAVGKEFLPSVFANEGCNILATDCPAEIMDIGWEKTNQYSKSKYELYHSNLVSKEIFEKNVEFESIDMRSIPHTLIGFDFLWSACALEHLGSITAAKYFIERCMDCLKPGGIAVHTTEYNLSSAFNTQNYNSSVFLRSIDFIEICETLVNQGHSPEPLDFRLDNSKFDNVISFDSTSRPHFKPYFDDYIVTSFGLIVRKGEK